MSKKQTSTKTKKRSSGLAGARGSALSSERAEQIINNVAEEYVDQGKTNFATKSELCETIKWLQLRDLEKLSLLRGELLSISTKAITALMSAADVKDGWAGTAGDRLTEALKEREKQNT